MVNTGPWGAAEDDARRIERLPELIGALPLPERELVRRLFEVVAVEGETVPPPEMTPWIERTFGSVEAVRRQRVIRVLNRWTFEGTTFNPLRSRRPGASIAHTAVEVPSEVRERIAASAGDDLCEPERRTPADTFGRVRTRHVRTASNVAKADGWHGVGVFDRHDPLALDGALVEDALAAVGEWAVAAHAADPEARHLFLFWNCLWRAGASLVHGHVQMTLSRGMAHARVELWRAAAERYRSQTGGDYFADLAAAHRALGLALGDGDAEAEEEAKTQGFASLTPIKEREIVHLAPTYGDGRLRPEELGVLAEPLARTLLRARDALGVLAFNVAVYGPPLAAASSDGAAAWAGFPLVARFVDRGSPLSLVADMAAMELFGSSVVASDPFAVARALRQPPAAAEEEA
jgi:hypothetical protein